MLPKKYDKIMSIKHYVIQFKKWRYHRYQQLFSARALAITGLFIMPALLFNSNTYYRVLFFLFFWFLLWLCGQKNRMFFTLFTLIFVIAFNLILPYGKVLYALGPFKITQGALDIGINRAVTLGGLIMLSRLTIRADLKLPGSYGQLIGHSLRLYAVILSQKNLITKKNLFTDIDNLMLSLSRNYDENDKLSTAPHDSQPMAIAILIILVLLVWLPLLLTTFI
jgi:heptaprenyl diphosphate synthase